MVDLIPVSSTRVTHYGYGDETATVYVRFHGGACYEYRHVPPHVWADFQASGSKGQFIHAVLDNYDYGPSDC